MDNLQTLEQNPSAPRPDIEWLSTSWYFVKYFVQCSVCSNKYSHLSYGASWIHSEILLIGDIWMLLCSPDLISQMRNDWPDLLW